MNAGRLICASALALLSAVARAQTCGISTNLLSDAVAAPSLTLSAMVSRQWTLGIGTTFCPVSTSSCRLQFVSAGVEARRWLYEPYVGHFLAFGTDWVGYRIGERTSPYRGNGVTAGIGYGYAWMIGRRWDIECSAGIGLAATFDHRDVTDQEDGTQYIHSFSRMTIIPYSVRVAVTYLF